MKKFELARIVFPACPFMPGLISVEKVRPFFLNECRYKILLDALYPSVCVLVKFDNLEIVSPKPLIVFADRGFSLVFCCKEIFGSINKELAESNFQFKRKFAR